MIMKQRSSVSIIINHGRSRSVSSEVRWSAAAKPFSTCWKMPIIPEVTFAMGIRAQGAQLQAFVPQGAILIYRIWHSSFHA
jgi:hypothetical protein